MLVLPIWLVAQSNSLTTKGGIGSVTLGDEVYNKISLAPELAIWKLGVGLNIELLLNKDGEVYQEDWDEPEDYVEKILYFRFAQKDDPFYFLVGNIESYTLGHGLIMKNYTNMLLYPEKRKLGGMIGCNIAGVSAEFFSADLIENDILGSRIAYSPVKRLQFGVSAAADLDQFNGISDADDDGYPDVYDDYPEDADYFDKYQKDKDRLKDAWTGTESEFKSYYFDLINSGHIRTSDLRKSAGADKEVYEVGFDYSVDIFNGDILSVQNYGEAAQIIDHGFGFVFPGVKAKFLFLELDLGYCQYEKEFIANYFDELYDQNRVVTSTSGDTVSIVTRKESLENETASKGWHAEIGGDLFGFFDLMVSYSDMQYEKKNSENDSRNQSIEGMFRLQPGVVPKVSTAYIRYKQVNEPQMFKEWKTENTFVEGKIAFILSQNTTVNWLYSERYIDLDGNGKIKGEEEIISNISFGLEMTF